MNVEGTFSIVDVVWQSFEKVGAETAEKVFGKNRRKI